jgi:hypothetical protein
MVNRWFTRYLYGVQNDVESQPKSWVVRSDPGACPPRQSTVTAAATDSTTITVADASVFPLGFQLTVPQASGNVNRIITDISGNTLTLASAVTVASGATVSLTCNNANPTPYAEWPDPAAAPVTQKLTPGAPGRGALGFTAKGAANETLTDDATVRASTSMNAATSTTRLVYETNALTRPVRISGTPYLNLRIAFSKPKANLTGILISYPAGGGNGTILSRGWLDPENRDSMYRSDPITPGQFYDLRFDLQPKDMVVPAGRRLAFMVLSSDNEHTLRPKPGTQLTVDTAHSSVELPIVGGDPAFAAATGAAFGEVGGTVPATLALTMGAPASFGAFTPGLEKDYTAATTATVTSTAGDASLSVSDPGHLTNGAFTMPEPLQVALSKASWDGPASNEAVTVTFTQHVNETDALRTGSYAKTLTFTLSTTSP